VSLALAIAVVSTMARVAAAATMSIDRPRSTRTSGRLLSTEN
jgi:hypothetical protein